MNKLSKSLRSAGLLTMLLAFCGVASAQTTYNLAAFPFSYNGTTSVSAKLTTSVSGSFSGELAIENIFNNASYEATLYGSSGVLTHLDNTNSTWDLVFSGTSSAALVVDPSQITLSFATPDEYTGAVLLLRSTDSLSVFQYRQENNVSDYNFVGYAFNAVFSAGASPNYGTTFVFPVVNAVPEPETYAMLLAGLGLVGMATRRRVC